ncbi:MAG: DUF4136 domain-containing protein [Proteobacteria bacterium]|nr:DUF4136 domain-containing protein [Pseudomonadota bacterium]
MKTITGLLIMLVGFIFLMGGCSGIRVSQDYEPAMVFSNLKTYSIKQKESDKAGHRPVDNPLVNERIIKALGRTLSEKGFAEVKTNPDVWVSYQYVIQTKIASSSTGPSLGIGFGLSSRNSALGFSTGTDISQYDEGQLIIDFKQGNTGKLLWRGTSTFRVETHIKPEKMTEKINLAVKKSLDQFPPK